jgi:hypothetical protein
MATSTVTKAASTFAVGGLLGIALLPNSGQQPVEIDRKHHPTVHEKNPERKVAGDTVWKTADFSSVSPPRTSRSTKQARNRKGVYVTKSQYGDDWPFTIESGYVESVDYAVVFHGCNGTTYALNGIARGQGVYEEIDPIWKPDGLGGRKSVGQLIQVGRDSRPLAARSETVSGAARHLVSKRHGNDLKKTLLEAYLKSFANNLLPHARLAAALSKNGSDAGQTYLDSTVGVECRKDYAFTDRSSASNGSANVQIDIDKDDFSASVRIYVGSYGCESVDVNVQLK